MKRHAQPSGMALSPVLVSDLNDGKYANVTAVDGSLRNSGIGIVLIVFGVFLVSRTPPRTTPSIADRSGS